MQKLERELHTRLFERSSRQVKLTSPGESFLAHAKLVLETLDKAVGEVKSRSKEITGTLRIGAIPTIAPYPLALKKSMKSQDIRNHPLLILQEGHCFRNQSLAYCRFRRLIHRLRFKAAA